MVTGLGGLSMITASPLLYTTELSKRFGKDVIRNVILFVVRLLPFKYLPNTWQNQKRQHDKEPYHKRASQNETLSVITI